MEQLKEKILLLLYAGIAFSFCYTPSQHRWVIKSLGREWKKINKKHLQYEIKKLYQSKMIEKKENSDGTTTIFLTDKGRIRALVYRFEDMKIDKRHWDNKWRIVVFDVPERFRKGRDALRWKLKEIGFYELQKSVFVFPYNCKDEIDFIIEFFRVRKYVRFGVLETIDNEIHLKEIFGLN